MFKSKSSFNPRNKDAVIEMYFSSLENKLVNFEIPQIQHRQHRHSLTREKRCALYNLKMTKML